MGSLIKNLIVQWEEKGVEITVVDEDSVAEFIYMFPDLEEVLNEFYEKVEYYFDNETKVKLERDEDPVLGGYGVLFAEIMCDHMEFDQAKILVNALKEDWYWDLDDDILGRFNFFVGGVI